MSAAGLVLSGACVVGLAEAALRQRSSRLPQLRLWHDAVAQLKVAQMDDRRRRGETGGVVFAGSSQVLEGLDPRRAAPDWGRGAYNAALHRGFLPLTEPWLLQEVIPRLRPRLVVLGVGVIDLTDNGTAQHEVLQRFESSPARKRGAVARWRRLVGRSAVLRHGLARLGPTVVLDTLRVGPDGEGREFADATEYRLSDKKRAYIEHELLAGYHTGPACQATLRRILDGIVGAGAAVVVVELPHTDELLEMLPGGAAAVEAARSQLRQVVAEAGVPFVDDLALMDDHLWFADCIHLNGAGMREASRRLAVALEPELVRLGPVGS
jgi:lysophospholipase L1-like esterase